MVAGDLFEDNSVSNDTIYRALDALKEAEPIPVFVIPGNHDPLTPDSVYDRSAWASGLPANVTVQRKLEPVKLDEFNAVLYPCPLSQKQCRGDPTAWIVESNFDSGQAIRLGLAHGALDIHGKRYNFPIPPDRARTASLDYLALRDWHSTYLQDARTAYSRTPEQTDFGEQGTRNVLLVKIPGKGHEPTNGLEGRLRTELAAFGAKTLDDAEERLRKCSDLESSRAS